MLKSVIVALGRRLPKSYRIVSGALFLALSSAPVAAQNATWNGTYGFWDLADSWTPNTQPTGTAFFTGTTPNNSIAVNGPTAIQTINYAIDAAAYTIIVGGSVQFDITGTGIVNNSANTQNFQNNGGLILFSNSASAGTNTSYTGTGNIAFNDNSTAGTATINVTGDVTFRNFSNATSANITAANVIFIDTGNAGAATINATGTVTFQGGFANAGTATISANTVEFLATSNANDATITSNGLVRFTTSSTAGTSDITVTGPGAILNFSTSSTAANSVINIGNGARLEFFGSSTTAGNATITIDATSSAQFNDFTNAGTATITNAGAIDFFNQSSASDANFTNTGIIGFTGVNSSVIATASTAHFDNNATGQIFFNTFSTAANATFTNSGLLVFGGNSTAANANITNNASGELRFEDTTNAGDATILNNGLVRFIGSSSAANAAFTNNAAGELFFRNSSTAANATFTNAGDINFEGTSTAANATFTNGATGIIIFNDNSTAANATFTSTGIVEFRDDSTAGSATITNNSPGDINFFNNASAANATITNNALMVFFNNSTAANANITNNGALQFSNNSTAANATITNNLILGFVDNSTGGNARFINNAGGTVDFSTTTGPLGDGAISAGSIEGAGNFILGSNTLTVGSRNLSTEVSGVISGVGGSLIKTGIGTLTLSGINTYTGPTDIWQGGLVINGSVTSNTTVFSNATLGGDGTIFGNLTVQSNGVLSPGNSIGTMTVNGNATFNSAVYVVEVTPANSDRTNVTGTAQINGGIVEVQSLSPSNTYAPTQTYTILNAAGGVTGTFTNVFDNLAFYQSSLSYDANNVYLTLTAQAAQFASFANTPNTINVAGALDAADPSSALISAMQGFTNDEVRAALPMLSGELFATMAGAFIDESRLFRTAILSRLRNTAFAGFSGPLGYLSDQSSASAYAAPAQARTPFDALRPSNRGFEYWGQAFGSWAKYNADLNTATTRRATGGFIVGTDRLSGDNIRTGLSAGYSNTQLRVTERRSKADADSFHLAAYLSKNDGRWSYRSGAALAAHNVDSERNVLGANLRANYFALTGQVFGEIGYGMSAGRFAVEPFINLALVHHYTNGFTETGGVPALTTGGFDNTLGLSTIGMRFATQYSLSNGWVMVPRATFAWQHTLGNPTPTAALAFQNTGTGMTIAGTPISRDTLLTEIGFDTQVSKFQTLGLFYAATAASDYAEHSVRARYEWKF